MSQEKPDIDMLALASLTKGGLRDIDNNSMGGTPRADKLDIQKLAGISSISQNPPKNRGKQYHPGESQRITKKPNMLSGFDFIEHPKSRPLGQVDMNGIELPEMLEIPENQSIEFAPIPESIRDNVRNIVEQIEHVEQNPYARDTLEHPPVSIPTPEMDFDLFQFTMLKDMVKNLDVSIVAMEGAIKHLTDKRDMLINALKGD